MALLRRDPTDVESVDVFDRLDRMFDEWMRGFPFRRSVGTGRGWPTEDLIRVDQYRERDEFVVKAELPGIDPDKDVELTVSDNMLHIAAERREEEKTEEKGFVRREIRSGSFSRSLPLPKGVSEADIKATYTDGILEIRIPAPEAESGKKIPIAKKT
jgi:HSP20 family protein